jgi:hypothetical protein
MTYILSLPESGGAWSGQAHIFFEDIQAMKGASLTEHRDQDDMNRYWSGYEMPVQGIPEGRNSNGG